MINYNVGDKVVHKDYPRVERIIEEIVLRRDEFIIHLCGCSCDYKVSDLIKVGTPEDTATKMLIASQVNETNAERAKEVVDYIVEKIQEVKR